MRAFDNTTWRHLLGFLPSGEQLAAITAPMEPALVMAGAGTGKTSVMAARIAWAIATGQAAPSQVLGLTFTTKAATELSDRVRALMPRVHQLAGTVANDDVEPTVVTYNAFGGQLLREHALRVGVEPDARVVVDVLRYQLAFRVVARTEVDLAAVGYSPAAAVRDVLDLDAGLGNYLIEPQDVVDGEQARLEAFAGRESDWKDYPRFIDQTAKRIAVAQLVGEFRQAKADYDVVDYSDQIRLAAQAAVTSQTMRDMLCSQYRVVLLDEYQDTSVAQKVLLQQLFCDGFPVMAVGDPCQAIYRWRGADIANMESFTQDFPRIVDGRRLCSAVYPLTVNRRSSQGVLDAANSISAPLRDLHQDIGALVSGRDDLPTARLEVGLYETAAQEVSAAVTALLDHSTQGRQWSDMAVLVRDNKAIPDFVAALESAHIPVQVADAGALVELPEVREVLCYLQVIADPTANPALARILAGPRFAIGARDLAVLGRHAADLAQERFDTSGLPIDVQLDHIVAGTDRAARVSLLDALEQCDDPRWDYSLAARERMSRLAAELRDLRRYCREPLLDIAHRVIRVTGLGVEASVRTLPDGSSHHERLALLLDLIGAFRDLDDRMGLDAFLAYVRDADRYDVHVDALLPRPGEAVTVMTVHKSKGLEFDVVVIPGLSKTRFPSGVAEKYWPMNAAVVPPHYVRIATAVSPLDCEHPEHTSTLPVQDPLCAFPGALDRLEADYEDHTSAVAHSKLLDETRLAYVAVTRAATAVHASGSWWGPTQATRRGPSQFLNELAKHATALVEWFPDPGTGAKNPAVLNTPAPTWPAPQDQDRMNHLMSQAELVKSAVSEGDEPEIAAQWDKDIDAVLSQLSTNAPAVHTVTLPHTLTATQVMALLRDEQAFLRALVRPMPRQPSDVAQRGTVFHAWVEEFYGNRGLFGPDDLPGAVDSEIYDDAALSALQQAFAAGRFAMRTPEHIETPFALVIGGRTLRGRIDAIFRGTLDDPRAPDSWLVVDWKTGAPGSADPVQLDIYRHAWAQIADVDPSVVQAVFYYVGHDHVETVASPMTREQLSELL